MKKFLTGTYYHTVDDKKRIRIPAKIRADMFPEDEKAQKNDGKYMVYFRFGTDGRKCISVYTEEVVNSLLEKISDIKESSGELYWAATMYSASFKLIESDQQGRLVIPQEFVEFGRIDKDIVIIGNRDHAEIWAEKEFKEQNEKKNLDLTTAVHMLGM